MTINMTKEEILILIDLLKLIGKDHALNVQILDNINATNEQMDLIFVKLKAQLANYK